MTTSLSDSSEHPLLRFIEHHPRLLVLTGAGISTDSGIPDYRDDKGEWKTSKPVQGPDFIREPEVQKRYWARSVIGWRNFGKAQPNGAHRALAALEKAGFVEHIVTQNVDGLHQRSGSQQVTDLHGRLDRVICLQCASLSSREDLQKELETLNPDFLDHDGPLAPDGDVHIERPDFHDFHLPACKKCGGAFKPDVVFYGESVPKARVETAMDALARSDALLVVGSSLMVYSGFRFCRRAQELGKAQAAINLGVTRADELMAFKIQANCSEVLQQLTEQLLNTPAYHATRSL